MSLSSHALIGRRVGQISRTFIPFRAASTNRTAPMVAASAGRAAFKQAVKAGEPTFGLFLDSASPLVAEQVACVGYDYVLVSGMPSRRAMSVSLGAHSTRSLTACLGWQCEESLSTVGSLICA